MKSVNKHLVSCPCDPSAGWLVKEKRQELPAVAVWAAAGISSCAELSFLHEENFLHARVSCSPPLPPHHLLVDPEVKSGTELWG